MFNIIKNLYTERNFDWLRDVDEENIYPIVLFNVLLQDETIGFRIKWLSKYVFYTSPKTFLALLHCCVPKQNSAPRFEMPSKSEVGESEEDMLMNKIRIYFKNSEKEFNFIKEYVAIMISDDLEGWKKKFGVVKREII